MRIDRRERQGGRESENPGLERGAKEDAVAEGESAMPEKQEGSPKGDSFILLLILT